MRFFEAFLLLGCLASFVLLLIPRLRRTRWPLYAALCAALLAVAQISIEGARWQMVPAYALAALFLAVAFVVGISITPEKRSFARRFAKGSAIGAAALGLAIACALPAIVPIFELPVPTGPYPIGTATYHLVDRSRADWGDKDAPRELMVQVWYPASKPSNPQYDTYVQQDMDFSTLVRGMGLPGFFFDHMKQIPTHAIKSAPMAAGGKRFPIILFSPGAQGFRQHNMFQVEELVSKGYVVAGIDHPRAATHVVLPGSRHVEFDAKLIDIPRFFKDPKFGDRIYNYLGEDASFALGRMIALDRADPMHILTNRLDTAKAGILGMSLGGLTAAEACRIDARFKACFIQDVFVPHDVMAEGVAQPTMWFTRDADSMRAEGWPEWEVAVHQDSMRTAFESVRSDGYLVKLPGMFHVNYTDFPSILATPVARKIGMIGAIDPRYGHRVTNAYTVAFFDHHLKGKPEPLLDGPSKRFPEIGFEARHRR